MNLNSIARKLIEHGVGFDFVTAGDKRVARKIAMAILKDKVGLRELKRLEADMRKDITKGNYTKEKASNKFEELTSWFVREYAKKHEDLNIDSATVNEVTEVLVSDFESTVRDMHNEDFSSGLMPATAGDKRVARKIALAILKDKVAGRELKRLESELRKVASKGNYSQAKASKTLKELASWFVREYAKKHEDLDIDSSTVGDVTDVLVEDFETAMYSEEQQYADMVPATAGSNEADFYTNVVFGQGRSGSDAFLSFLRALRPFMLFGLRDFRQASNGNWFARGRYIVLEFGNTDPKSLLNGKGQIRVNYIKATTPAQDWEDKFDKILREFTDSFQKKNAERVTAAVSEEQIEDRDTKARSVQIRLRKAGIEASKPSSNKERVKVSLKGTLAKNIKKLSAVFLESGWKKTKAEGDEIVFGKGQIRISLREKDNNTVLRIRHKDSKDWAGRVAKKASGEKSAADHVNVPPSYLGVVKIPAVFKKSGSLSAVKFQGRRVYFYKPVKISQATLERILTNSPVSVNAYVRAGKVEIAAVYDTKTKKPFVRATKKTATTTKKV